MIPGSCDTIKFEIAYSGAAGSHLLILKSILPRANFEGFSGSDRSWEVFRARACIGYVLIRRSGYQLKEVAGQADRSTDKDLRKPAESTAKIL
jgi:hypothetical protein